MKTLLALFLFATAAFAGYREDAPQSARNDWREMLRWLNAPVAWSTNTATLIATNDLNEVALIRYLRNNAPAGITAESTPAQIRTAWSNAVETATSANKPRVLSEQAIWMPAWFTYRTLPDNLPDYSTNSVTSYTPMRYRWQDYGFPSAPTNINDLEAP